MGRFLPIIAVLILFVSCQRKYGEITYTSDLIKISRISKHAYVHTSYLQTDDFGNVPCNGLLYAKNGEAIVFDTPVDDSAMLALLDWTRENLQSEIKAVVATHFHEDCLGGLGAVHSKQIPSYALEQTVILAREEGYILPQNTFRESMEKSIGNTAVHIIYYGAGHTPDNVIGYIPDDQVLFGGCLIKSMNASKGYLGDAVVNEWSATVTKIKKAYPDVRIVVPGHGATGGSELLDYTISLFKEGAQ